jgi:hypothetical protein
LAKSAAILPVLLIAIVSELFAILLVRLFDMTNTNLGYFQPFGQSPAGSLGASLLLVIPMAGAAFFFLWVIRRNRVNFLKALLISLTTLSCLILSFVTFEILFIYLTMDLADFLSVVLASIVAFLVAYVGFRPTSKFSLVAVVVLSAEIGGFLAMVIPVPTIFVLPAIVSIYDVYAVFRGPLGKLIDSSSSSSSEETILVPITATVADVQIGLGDLVFYGMVVAEAFRLLTLQFALLTSLAMNIGIILTLILTFRRRALPGLPVPMLFGVITLFLAWSLSR